jgi:hypothetical protein
MAVFAWASAHALASAARSGAGRPLEPDKVGLGLARLHVARRRLHAFASTAVAKSALTLARTVPLVARFSTPSPASPFSPLRKTAA